MNSIKHLIFTDRFIQWYFNVWIDRIIIKYPIIYPTPVNDYLNPLHEELEFVYIEKLQQSKMWLY